MSISNDQLLDIIAEASYRLHKAITSAHRENRLDNYLRELKMDDLIPRNSVNDLFETNINGKIIIFGDAKIKESEIYGCAKQLGLGKDRIETYLDYKQVQKFDFNKLRYNPNYRLILFGPIPHSVKGKEESSSILARVENEDGYPKSIRLMDAHQLKITKTNFKATLKAEIDKGYLAVSSL